MGYQGYVALLVVAILLAPSCTKTERGESVLAWISSSRSNPGESQLAVRGKLAIYVATIPGGFR